jgi:hypothetical protein
MLSKKFLWRLFMVELVIFAIVGLVSLASGMEYGVALILAGFGAVVLGFMGSSSGARLQGIQRHGLGSNTMEQQFVRDFNDYEQIERTQSMLYDLIVISAIPIFVGIVMLMIFKN